MKAIDSCADLAELLAELGENLGETALPDSCDWPAKGATSA